MDMEKIQVRQDLSRMVMNYVVRGSITEDQSARICNYIDSTIGGGDFEQTYRSKKGGAVIPFPTSYAGEKEPVLSDYERAEQTAKLAAQSEIYAPYGEPLPEGVHDFRQTLQRDGLVLIYYEMRTSREGNFLMSYGRRATATKNQKAAVLNGVDRYGKKKFPMFCRWIAKKPITITHHLASLIPWVLPRTTFLKAHCKDFLIISKA